MRPPEFTGGNAPRSPSKDVTTGTASMRPPEFTGGNIKLRNFSWAVKRRFNEAAGIHRRKRRQARCGLHGG